MAKKLGEVTSQIVELLSPFSGEDQSKIVGAAMVLLGHSNPQTSSPLKPIGEAVIKPADGTREGTINVVTAKLGAGSCRQILLAAAVHLSLFQGKSKWTRDEWMQLAADARDWKAAFRPQASRDMGRLVKSGEIIENSKDMFSLPSSTLAEVQSKF